MSPHVATKGESHDLPRAYYSEHLTLSPQPCDEGTMNALASSAFEEKSLCPQAAPHPPTPAPSPFTFLLTTTSSLGWDSGWRRGPGWLLRKSE